MPRPKLSKLSHANTPNLQISSLRYMLAELRPLAKPEVWASGVILIILGLFAWEYWNQPSNRSEFASDQPDGNFVDEAQAIAQDIDNSALLRQDLSSTTLPNSPLNAPAAINPPNNSNANTGSNKSSLAPGVAAFLSLMTNSPLSNPQPTNPLSPTALTGFGLGGAANFNSSLTGLSTTPSSGGLLLTNPGNSPSLSGLSPSTPSGIAPTNTALSGTGSNSFMGTRAINATGISNLTGTMGTLSPTATGLSGIGNTGIANPVGTTVSQPASSSPLPGSAVPTARPGIYISPLPTASYYTQPPQLTPAQPSSTPAIAPSSLNGVNAPYAVPGNQVGNGLGNPITDPPIDPLDVEPDPFSVPRAAPGRYIGNGNINTFANP